MPEGAVIRHSTEADKTEPDLLPCPFCGGEAGFGSSWADTYFVNCLDCMASTNVLLEDRDRFTKEEAAAAWNRRSTGEPK